MTVSFGPPRRNLPPSNLGQNFVAQRRVSQAVARAAARTSLAISVDAHPCRIWTRNLRGAIPCPCSMSAGGKSSFGPTGDGQIIIEPNEGDDLGGPDSGYPYPPSTTQPSAFETPEGVHPSNVPGYIDDFSRMLLGNGKRCGICWGTGWLDGYLLWGGLRLVCCIADTLNTTVNDISTAYVDLNAQTPSLLGPEDADTPLTASWTVEIPPGFDIVDALRVRDGMQPAVGNWSVQAITPNNPTWTDAAVALGIDYGIPGCTLQSGNIPTQIQVTLGQGARVSHIELVLRSVPLVNIQMPQIQMTASAELAAPFISEEVEIDPVVGFIERGTILELPSNGSNVGSVWVLSDVTPKRDAQGVMFGLIGNARNVQPTEVWAAASLEDALSLGTLNPGMASRGLESTGGGEASGIAGITDASVAAAKRGSQPRYGGGARASTGGTIVLSSHIED